MSKGAKRRLTWVTPRLKMELLANKRRRWAASRAKEQDGKCYWCGKRMLDPAEDARSFLHITADHLTPLSKGGADHFENIVAAHKRCNEAKADLLPEEFAEPGTFVWRPGWAPTTVTATGA